MLRNVLVAAAGFILAQLVLAILGRVWDMAVVPRYVAWLRARWRRTGRCPSCGGSSFTEREHYSSCDGCGFIVDKQPPKPPPPRAT